MVKNRLDELRKQIDDIDHDLLELLSYRFRVVAKIGRLKRKLGIEAFDKKRWQKLLEDRVKQGGELELPKNFIISLYNEVHRQSLKKERKIKKKGLIIGIQGGRGSFNEEALNYYTRKKNLDNIIIKYLYTSEKVLSCLESGEIERGQMAIYNSTSGIVEESIKTLASHKVKIIDRFAIKITHALMIRKDVSFSEITTIMTHPQVFVQCQHKLKIKYPQLKQISGKEKLIDQAVVAEFLAKDRLPKYIAVIGSKILAKIYNLRVIEDNLQDREENYTTFLQIKSL